ncbi:MAG: PrsW family intramembrane metalloprotease [Candidatus Mcinerneyibacterium aminivorans]|uniref:Protease PrsW n=1 Tax=Candidatus Mcinerneyibacterium aminivorans TaxID=2703815 RepID=A0A5D0MCT4_9BACT|nr:MAG: PrsW family intramembrane metalloprotease [Candidatus Mcinerneyibacterium aminivorans]
MFYFFLAILPGILIIVYFYKRDRLEPEPKWMIVKTFFLGILASSAALFFNSLFGGIFQNNLLIGAVLIAPIVEESCKFYSVKYFRFKDKHFTEPMDGIVYGVTVAVGFAVMENLNYVYRALQEGHVYYTLIIRGFLSVPAHALFAVIWGYALGMYKFGKKDENFVKNSLIQAMIFHSAFNAIAVLVNPIWDIFYLALLSVYLWYIADKDIRSAIKNSPYQNDFDEEK